MAIKATGAKRGWQKGRKRPPKVVKSMQSESALRLVTKFPQPIATIDEQLIGKTIWFFHPRNGVSHIKVTGLRSVQGRSGQTRWGLFFDFITKRGLVLSNTFWVSDYPIFPTRAKCVNWVRAMLTMSDAETKVDDALGIEL